MLAAVATTAAGYSSLQAKTQQEDSLEAVDSGGGGIEINSASPKTNTCFTVKTITGGTHAEKGVLTVNIP